MKKNGFTLIELLIAMAVFSLFMGAAYKLFVGGQKQAQVSMWNQSAITSLRNAFRVIETDLGASSYPSVVLEDTMLDPTDGGGAPAALKCNYLKTLEAPAEGDFKTFLTFPVSKPFTGKGKGEVTFKVFGLLGEVPRSAGGGMIQNLGSLVMAEFQHEYDDKDFKSASCSKGAYVRHRIILPNVKKIDIEALQSLELRIVCEMPNQPKTLRQSVGSVKPNVEFAEDSGVLGATGSKTKSKL